MKHKQRLHIKPMGAIVILLSIMLITGGVFILQKKEIYAQYNKNNKEIGEIKTIKSKDNNKIISIFYPEFKEEELNKQVRLVTKEVVSWKDKINKKEIIYSDYSTREVCNQYISVTIKASILDKNCKEKDSKEYHFTYDKKTNTILTVADTLRGQYRQALLQNNKLDDIDTKNTNLLVDKNAMYIYQDNKKISINYREYQEYIQLQNDTIVSNMPKDVKQPKQQIVDPNKPMIAITFDDGPHPKNTQQVLDLFNKYDSKATFFMLGSLAEKYPSIVKQVYEDGFEIANHSWSHENLQKSSLATMQKEIFQTQDIIFSITGKDPVLLRPPYGAFNDEVKKQAGDLHITLWDVDTLDWKYRDANVVKEAILNGAKDGSIILLHDIHVTSVEGMELALPILKERGYQLVTVDTLMKYKK